MHPVDILAIVPGWKYTVWLIIIWAIGIPAVAIVAITSALGQTKIEHEENLRYARGERPEGDEDVPVDPNA